MAVKKVRRNRSTGEIVPRAPGRPHPDFEMGYLDESGEFHAGEPPRRRRRRRRSAGAATAAAKPGPRAAVHTAPSGGLSEIENIIQREVNARVRAAKEKAIAALNSLL